MEFSVISNATKASKYERTAFCSHITFYHSGHFNLLYFEKDPSSWIHCILYALYLFLCFILNIDLYTVVHSLLRFQLQPVLHMHYVTMHFITQTV